MYPSCRSLPLRIYYSIKSFSLPPLYGPYPRYIYILLKISSNVESSWNQKMKNKKCDGHCDRHLFIFLEINYPFINFPRMFLGPKRRLEQNVTHSHLPVLFLLLNKEWFATVPVKYLQQELCSQVQEWSRETSSLFCMVLSSYEKESCLFL